MADPLEFPLPDQDFETLAPLWAGAKEGIFRLPRCRACGTFDWYPKGVCRSCGGSDIEWEVLSGRGTLYSWAVVHRALHKPLEPLGAYVSAIVRIAEDSKTRFVTRIVNADPQSLRSEMPVQVFFADAGYPALETGTIVPLFTPLPETVNAHAQS